MKRFSLLALASLSLLCLTHAAHAQYSESASTFIGAGQDNSFFGTGNSNSTGAFVSHSDTHSWTGMDSQGMMRTMTLTGTATGMAEFGRLHASATAMLTNPYYNPNNPVYFDGINPNTINQMGSPNAVEVQGFAGYTDTFTYTGFQGTGYKVRYLFHIGGSVNGDFIKSALINFTAGSDPVDILQTQGSSFDGSTADHDVAWGVPFTVDNRFYASAVQFLDTNNPAFTEGQTLSGTADYSSTMDLTGIEIFDPAGNALTGWGFESASGTHYNLIGGQYGFVAPVPEPGALALAFGLLAPGTILLRRRGQEAKH